jgi:CubicO group peptidase (beta-lactamase class C family)
MAMQNGYDFSATRQFLDRIVQSGAAAGVSLQVTRRGETILATQVGYADLALKKPIKPDTIFRIFSMTKPVTAVLFMMLYEKGLVHLSDPVSDFLPGFKNPSVWIREGDEWQTRPAKSEITLRHLLTMTSGIPYHLEAHPASKAIAAIAEAHYAAAAAGSKPSLANLANKIGAVPLVFDPGQIWQYGLSLDIIGAVIEVVAGKPFGQFMKEALLEPLAMRDTGFYVQPDQIERLATLYAEDQGQLTPNPVNHLAPGDPTQPPAIEYGGAGLYSTRSDYTRFARMLLGGGTLEGWRILSHRAVDLLSSNHLTPDQMKGIGWEMLRGFGYGLAVRSLLDPLPGGSLLKPGEFGWDGAAGTWFSVNPTDEMTIVYLVQRLPASHMRFIPRLQATIYAAL